MNAIIRGMKRVDIRRTLLGGLFLVWATCLSTSQAFALVMSSTDYRLDASVDASVGGAQGSASYKMTSSGGESVIGNGASGSYLLGAGYTAQLVRALQVSVASSANLGAITPGTSATTSLSVSVLTDAPGYSLAVSQDHDLQKGTDTIPAVSGSIATPVTWVEGSTKGFGFSLASTNATALPPKWSSGAAYAAFPASATTAYTRTGYSGGSTDTLGVNLRLDVANSQVSGAYSNIVTWTGTMTP